MAGNAAAGVALLNALQNSPLSGQYTAYNFYLQSAVDAGTLGGVETQVGGQVHADAVAYLMRQPLDLDAAMAPYTSGRGLAAGQARSWIAGLGGYVRNTGTNGIAGSSEQSTGTVAGGTYRINEQASASLGVGYDWGSVGSAGASADMGTLFGIAGGRYAFSSLDFGPFVAARVIAGGVDYNSRRSLGGNLGTARGSTSGSLYGGQAMFGDVLRLAPAIVTLQGGLAVTHASLGGFTESGSELALAVGRTGGTVPSMLADLEVSLDTVSLAEWRVTPSFTLGYQRMLSNPQIMDSGSVYNVTVSQVSAFNSRNLVRPGLGVAIQRRRVNVQAAVDALLGDGVRSSGVNGQLSASYRF